MCTWLIFPNGMCNFYCGCNGFPSQIAKDIYSTLNFGHKGWFSVEVEDWWYINIESTLYCGANLMIEISMFNQHLIYAGGGGEAHPSSHPPSSHLMIEISTLNQCLINMLFAFYFLFFVVGGGGVSPLFPPLRPLCHKGSFMAFAIANWPLSRRWTATVVAPLDSAWKTERDQIVFFGDLEKVYSAPV